MSKVVKNLIQIQNPKTKQWGLIDTSRGCILKHSIKPFKFVQIAKRNKLTKDKIVKAILQYKEKDLKIKPIHILSRNSKWVVYSSIAKRALKIEKYRELAFLYACNVAKKDQKIYVHRKDGTVEFEFEITNE